MNDVEIKIYYDNDNPLSRPNDNDFYIALINHTEKMYSYYKWPVRSNKIDEDKVLNVLSILGKTMGELDLWPFNQIGEELKDYTCEGVIDQYMIFKRIDKPIIIPKPTRKEVSTNE